MAIHALIIDDDKMNLEVLGLLLKSQGVSSTPLQDPSKLGSVLTEDAQFDLVFLDLEMPKVNGYEMFNLLREHLGDAIPIIACTVHLNEMESTREIGFSGFIGKPLDRERFVEQFNRILNNQPVWDTN
jgi:two-component system cell cycle response regulator DivK